MYGIQFVDALPEGHDFMFVQTDGGALIFYREDALTPETLEDSWAAYRAIVLSSEPPAGGAQIVPFAPRHAVADGASHQIRRSGTWPL